QICPPAQVRRPRNDRSIVNTRSPRSTRAFRRLQSVLAHQAQHPIFARPNAGKTQLRPHLAIAFADKRRLSQHRTNPLDELSVAPRCLRAAARRYPCRRLPRLTLRIYARARHARDFTHHLQTAILVAGNRDRGPHSFDLPSGKGPAFLSYTPITSRAISRRRAVARAPSLAAQSSRPAHRPGGSSTRLSRSPKTSRARRTRSPRSPSAPATTYPSPRPLTGAGPLPSSSSPTSGRAQCHSNQSFFFAFGHSFGGVTFPQNCVQGNSKPTQRRSERAGAPGQVRPLVLISTKEARLVRIITWNLQGSSHGTEDKWNRGLLPLMQGSDGADVLCVQECGKVPDSAEQLEDYGDGFSLWTWAGTGS